MQCLVTHMPVQLAHAQAAYVRLRPVYHCQTCLDRLEFILHNTPATLLLPCRQAQLQRGHEDYQSIARREQREQEKRRVDQARDAERKSREEVCISPLLLALLSVCFLTSYFPIILHAQPAPSAAVHTSQFNSTCCRDIHRLLCQCAPGKLTHQHVLHL